MLRQGRACARGRGGTCRDRDIRSTNVLMATGCLLPPGPLPWDRPRTPSPSNQTKSWPQPPRALGWPPCHSLTGTGCSSFLVVSFRFAFSEHGPTAAKVSSGQRYITFWPEARVMYSPSRQAKRHRLLLFSFRPVHNPPVGDQRHSLRTSRTLHQQDRLALLWRREIAADLMHVPTLLRRRSRATLRFEVLMLWRDVVPHVGRSPAPDGGEPPMAGQQPPDTWNWVSGSRVQRGLFDRPSGRGRLPTRIRHPTSQE